MPARAVATRGSAMAAGGLPHARSVCRGSPVLCHSLDENLRLIGKPSLCGRPIGRVVARNRLLTPIRSKAGRCLCRALLKYHSGVSTGGAGALRPGTSRKLIVLSAWPAFPHLSPHSGIRKPRPVWLRTVAALGSGKSGSASRARQPDRPGSVAALRSQLGKSWEGSGAQTGC
jgi:hypothetical protein